MLEVTTEADIVNGDVSSPQRLAIAPGPDGLSLREALESLRRAIRPVQIGFSATMAGRTIRLRSALPPIARDGVSITGPVSADGTPSVTVDAAGQRSVFVVAASSFSVSGMRLVGMKDGGGAGVYVRTGRGGEGGQGGPDLVSDLRIEGNVFDGAGIRAFGVSIGSNRGALRSAVRNVTITRNRFSGFAVDADAIHVQLGGNDTEVTDLTISENHFSQNLNGIELVPIGNRARLANVRIGRNTFVDNVEAVLLLVVGDPTPANGNVIEDVAITDNTLRDNTGRGVGINSGFGNASENVIRRITVADNAISGSASAVHITGGHQGGRANRVESVVIARNRMRANGTGILVAGGTQTAGDNRVIDTKILDNEIADGTGAGVTIVGGLEASGNRVERTTLVRSRLRSNEGPAITITGGTRGGSANAIADVAILSSVLTRTRRFGVVAIIGGRDGARDNEVAGIRIVNATVAFNQGSAAGPALSAQPTLPRVAGDLGNVVRDISVLNSIFWGNASDFFGIRSEDVRFTLTSQPGFAASSDLALDPRFRDAQAGDLRLAAGSPAIDRGSSEGAPELDVECRSRVDAPEVANRGAGTRPYFDLGAYEFGGPVSTCPDQ